MVKNSLEKTKMEISWISVQVISFMMMKNQNQNERYRKHAFPKPIATHGMDSQKHPTSFAKTSVMLRQK